MHKLAFNRINFSILLPVIFILSIALSSFYSIDHEIFKQQAISIIVSIFVFMVFLNIDYRIFSLYAKPIYLITLFLLVFLFIIGVEARGAVRWVEIFGVRVQFSEIIKPFFIIFIAQFLVSNDSKTFTKFIKCLLIFSPIFFLILVQPDLGNALVYFFVFIFMLILYGFPLKYFMIFGAISLALMPIVFNFLHDYQKQRILTFIDPTSDPFGSSYNAVQSLVSIGSGGIFGKGFGQATQSILKFLPERHTDFIFATISENLGFFGAVLLTGLYAVFLYRIYKLYNRVNNELPKLIIAGFYFLFLTHIFLNIGMNIGIVPIVGITLPFSSYGGSSLVTSFIIVGIISSIMFDYNKKESIEIR